MRVKSVLLPIGVLIGAIVAFLLGSILFFSIGRRLDFLEQSRRVKALRELEPSPDSPSLAADLALPDGLPLNRLRMIATHNSYRKKADPLRLFIMGLAKPGEPAKLGYSHPALWDQLEGGVRSFELDLRFKKNRFECAHVPLVDDRSYVPDLRLGLEELVVWSERHPRHAPIFLLFELKDDYSFLDPELRPIGAPELDALDAVLRSALGSRLLSPDEMRGRATSPAAAAAKGAWPNLGAARGKLIVILHENEKYRKLYIEGKPNLEGRAMFTCGPEGSPDSVFAILNEPSEESAEIKKALKLGWIVRTRADADGIWDPKDLEAAIASGAQIISTDFPPAYPAEDGYMAALPGGKTLMKAE